MPISDEQLAAKGRAAFERIIASTRKSAVTGYPRGDGTSYIRTDPDGNTLSQNQVYVRTDEIFNGQPFPAWNTATAARAEQPVFIEKIKGRWEVTGLDSAKAEAVYGAAASELGSPDKFGATPNLTHSRDLIELRPRVWIPGTLKLNIEAGFYTDSAGNKAYWQPSNVNIVDAVADVPAASGGINQWQWEVLALNPDATTPVLALFHSTAQYVTLPLLPSQIASITITAGYKPIAAFILQTGDTTEANLAENDWVDLRLWLMSGGAGGSTSPLTTKGDLYGYSTVGARVPIGTDGQNLVADSTQALGLKWATPTAGVLSPSDDDVSNPPTEDQLRAVLDTYQITAGAAAIVDDAGLYRSDYLTLANGTGENLLPLARAPLNAVTSITAAAHAGSERQNSTTFRWEAILSTVRGGVTYQVYTWWNSSDHLVISVRTLDTTTFTDYVTAIVAATDDEHNVVSASFDPNGILHLSYDQHNDPLKYRRSTLPIESFAGALTSALSMLGTNESVITYPTFFNDEAGKLYFMFRTGIAYNGDVYFYKYDEATTTWSASTGTGTAGLLFLGTTASPTEGAYYWTPTFDPSGILHIFFCWRTHLDDTNKDMDYVKWDKTSFKKSSGASQTVPITSANAEQAVVIAHGTGLLNQGHGCDVDANNRPHVVYTRYSTGTTSQFYHLWFNGTVWVELQVTSVGQSGGWDSLLVLRPDLAIDRVANRAYMVYANKDDADGLLVMASEPGDFTTWTKTRIYTTDAGKYEPTHDRGLWQLQGILYIPIAEWFASGSAWTIKLLRWRPPAVGPDYQRIIGIADTKALCSALLGTMTEVVIARATDTGEIGVYIGGVWYWYKNTSFTVTGDTGTTTINNGDTLAVVGAAGLTTAVSGDTVTITPSSGGTDHLHGLARWTGDGSATAFELPDFAEYLELVFNGGSAVDPLLVSLSSDSTQVIFSTAPTAANVLEATYVIARL